MGKGAKSAADAEVMIRNLASFRWKSPFRGREVTFHGHRKPSLLRVAAPSNPLIQSASYLAQCYLQALKSLWDSRLSWITPGTRG